MRPRTTASTMRKRDCAPGSSGSGSWLVTARRSSISPLPPRSLLRRAPPIQLLDIAFGRPIAAHLRPHRSTGQPSLAPEVCRPLRHHNRPAAVLGDGGHVANGVRVGPSGDELAAAVAEGRLRHLRIDIEAQAGSAATTKPPNLLRDPPQLSNYRIDGDFFQVKRGRPVGPEAGRSGGGSPRAPARRPSGYRTWPRTRRPAARSRLRHRTRRTDPLSPRH